MLKRRNMFIACFMVFVLLVVFLLLRSGGNMIKLQMDEMLNLLGIQCSSNQVKNYLLEYDEYGGTTIKLTISLNNSVISDAVGNTHKFDKDFYKGRGLYIDLKGFIEENNYNFSDTNIQGYFITYVQPKGVHSSVQVYALAPEQDKNVVFIYVTIPDKIDIVK